MRISTLKNLFREYGKLAIKIIKYDFWESFEIREAIEKLDDNSSKEAVYKVLSDYCIDRCYSLEEAYLDKTERKEIKNQIKVVKRFCDCTDYNFVNLIDDSYLHELVESNIYHQESMQAEKRELKNKMDVIYQRIGLSPTEADDLRKKLCGHYEIIREILLFENSEKEIKTKFDLYNYLEQTIVYSYMKTQEMVRNEYFLMCAISYICFQNCHYWIDKNEINENEVKTIVFESKKI